MAARPSWARLAPVTDTQRFDAIVLAGGAARRLGGADKPTLTVGGSSLLERTLAAVAGAQRTIVVGPQRPVSRPVLWSRERPAGSGPVAAIAAGLRSADSDAVMVLAADMPEIAPAVPHLLSGLSGADAAVLVDSGGQRNYLAALWRRTALVSAVRAAGGPEGVPVRRLYERVHIIDILDRDGWGRDCDTWEQLAQARRHEQRGS